MSRGNRHVHRELHKNRLAFEAHSDVCEWDRVCLDPRLAKPCLEPSRWYHTTITGRYSLCDHHTPTAYRTDPIPAAVSSESAETNEN